MSLLAIAGLALKAGPALIRGVSSMFGGNETAEKVAKAVETVESMTGSSLEQKKAALESELNTLSPDERIALNQLKVELEKEVTKRAEIAAQDRQAEHHETQSTVRHSDDAKDPWVRRARPIMALTSTYATFVYVIAMSVLNALGKGTGPELGVTATLLGLAVTFMGLRWDEKKRGIAS
ncbi:3TM-type holin [Vibrio nomapromontoriensis]|uniref:3TM-type holin n=1 Tax=Vibrio nomapromontoriensis TaxID=2910246 RepID=UPI003D13204D